MPASTLGQLQPRARETDEQFPMRGTCRNPMCGKFVGRLAPGFVVSARPAIATVAEVKCSRCGAMNYIVATSHAS